MEDGKLKQADYQIFLYKTLFWLALAWGGFILSLAGFFYASIIWTGVILFAIFLNSQAIKHRVSFKLSKEMWIASLTVLAIVMIFSNFSTPTVFSGRDQGAISSAAIRLSQNHQFSFSTPASSEFFKLHEPGRAQNFPGFYYTSEGNLTSQFPLVYITWLALFYAIAGVNGFVIANALLLYIFLMSFYLTARLFLKTSSALPMMSMAATSFIFMWFSKYTLSENIALPLLWLSILSLLLFLKSQRKLHFCIFLFSTLLLCFARIEGYALLITSSIIVAANKDSRDHIKSNLFSYFILPAIFFIIVFIFNFLNDISFYRELAKAMLPSISAPKAAYLGNLKNTALPNLYMTKIFLNYGMLSFFVVGAIAIIKKFWCKDFYELVPFFVVSPTFIYLIDSNISSDQPWMLRRFMFSLLPVAIFYSGLLLGQLAEKNSDKIKDLTIKFTAWAAITIMLAMNLPGFIKYLSFSENKNLLSQVETLSSKFSPNDLILIDREVTGDGWTMISEPMSTIYGKNAVYFFNIQDLNKLDLSLFENVYLISPNHKVSHYQSSTIQERLSEVDEYTFNFPKLDSQQDNQIKKTDLPEKIQYTISGKIFKISK